MKWQHNLIQDLILGIFQDRSFFDSCSYLRFLFIGTGKRTDYDDVIEAGKEINMFERVEYVVSRIDGDYAYLKRSDMAGEEKCVARALLPEEIEEGCRVAYEMMEYSIRKD